MEDSVSINQSSIAEKYPFLTQTQDGFTIIYNKSEANIIIKLLLERRKRIILFAVLIYIHT